MLDFYQRLNIKRNASQDDIETAYARMALKHHPDVAGDSPKVQERFALINEAYTILSKPRKRTEYNEKLSTPEVIRREEVISTDDGRGSIESDSSSSRETEPHTQQAESRARASSGLMSKKKLERIRHEARKLIKAGDFWRANALMSKAVIAYPRDIELRKLLSQAAAGRGRLREAVEELKKASEVEYFNPEIHSLIGDMYLKGNQTDSAIRAYTDALSWQEDYKPALKGLARIRELKNKNLPWWKKLLRMGK
ncbi:MAG: DnaJ domain-containing protein [Candidatus Sabulitectum sp.]|nr:DnaJ domain-containing protein [Candidatus Sabulitectum sp.]